MTNKELEAISVMPNDGNLDHLLVILHGWGANYEDFAPSAKMLNLPGFGYFFPNAPFAHFQVPGGRAWYALESKEFTGLEQSRTKLINWLQSLEYSTGVPLERTIMAGFSQGGAMTLDVGATLPLAAICSLSGYLHYQPQERETANFPPVLIIHGKQDPVVPLQAAQQARDELIKTGVSVQYQEFNMGHEVQPAALQLLRQFIIKVSQKK